MSEEVSGALLEVARLASVGLVSGLFSLWVANRRHVNQEWWNQRREAYTRAIEALWDAFVTEDIELEELSRTEGPRRFSREESERLLERARTAELEVRRSRHAGALLLLPTAIDLLDDYLTRTSSDRGCDDYPEAVAASRDAAKSCLEALINEGKRDLGIGDRGLARWIQKVRGVGR